MMVPSDRAVKEFPIPLPEVCAFQLHISESSSAHGGSAFWHHQIRRWSRISVIRLSQVKSAVDVTLWGMYHWLGAQAGLGAIGQVVVGPFQELVVLGHDAEVVIREVAIRVAGVLDGCDHGRRQARLGVQPLSWSGLVHGSSLEDGVSALKYVCLSRVGSFGDIGLDDLA